MKKCEIAVYGLGVMGSSLAKNMISKGFSVAAYSKSESERERFQAETPNYVVCHTIEEMLGDLKSPRCIFLMITAGKPVDMVLEELLPLLSPGDVVMDGGNSYYKDTSRRCDQCKEQGIHYLGVGVSGGELGALRGPSMMVGGSKEGWDIVRPILQTIAAHAGTSPCCTYIAEEGAGHYVKMVHNGIEYGILQLLAETYHLMRYGLGLSEEETLECFESWQGGKLDSYLIDISVAVLKKRDTDGTLLVEKILDAAEQKGTGKWTILESIERGVYIPTIYEAVLARNFSGKKQLRMKGKELLSVTAVSVQEENPKKVLGDALLLGMILCYSQGLELILTASREEGWEIQGSSLAAVWRAGCIIRSSLLEEIYKASVTEEQPLLLDPVFSYIRELEPSLRKVNGLAEQAGISLPGLSSALHYYDYYRMEQMPVNFIQALRDCFGAHTYRRIDQEGYFHTQWTEEV